MIIMISNAVSESFLNGFAAGREKGALFFNILLLPPHAAKEKKGDSSDRKPNDLKVPDVFQPGLFRSPQAFFPGTEEKDWIFD